MYTIRVGNSVSPIRQVGNISARFSTDKVNCSLDRLKLLENNLDSWLHNFERIYCLRYLFLDDLEFTANFIGVSQVTVRNWLWAIVLGLMNFL